MNDEITCKGSYALGTACGPCPTPRAAGGRGTEELES